MKPTTPKKIKSFFTFTALVFGASLILLWSAFLNKYPLVFYDSGGYIDQLFSLRRASGYNWFSFFAVSVYHSLWSIVFAQSLITSFLLLRITSLIFAESNKKNLYTFIIFLLVVLTTGISKYSSWVMPDLFTAWLFLGGLFFVLSPIWRDRLIASLVITVSILSHYSHIPLSIVSALLMLFFGFIFRRNAKNLWNSSKFLALLAVLNVAFLCFLNFSKGGGFFPTYQGSGNFMLAKLAASDIAYRTLNTYCPEKQWKLCTYKDEFKKPILPHSVMLWKDISPLRKTYGWGGYWQDQSEQREIVSWAVRRYFPDIIKISLRDSCKLFFKFSSKDGLVRIGKDESVYYDLKTFFPQEFNSYLKSNQMQGSPKATVFSFNDNIGQYVIMILTLALFVIALRLKRYDIAGLIFSVIIFISLNALILGSLSEVADRYQGRVVWLLPYVFFISLLSIFKGNKIKFA